MAWGGGGGLLPGVRRSPRTRWGGAVVVLVGLAGLGWVRLGLGGGVWVVSFLSYWDWGWSDCVGLVLVVVIAVLNAS